MKHKKYLAGFTPVFLFVLFLFGASPANASVLTCPTVQDVQGGNIPPDFDVYNDPDKTDKVVALVEVVADMSRRNGVTEGWVECWYLRSDGGSILIDYKAGDIEQALADQWNPPVIRGTKVIWSCLPRPMAYDPKECPLSF